MNCDRLKIITYSSLVEVEAGKESKMSAGGKNDLYEINKKSVKNCFCGS